MHKLSTLLRIITENLHWTAANATDVINLVWCQMNVYLLCHYDMTPTWKLCYPKWHIIFVYAYCPTAWLWCRKQRKRMKMFNPSAKLSDRLESVSSVLETGTAKDGSSLVHDLGTCNTLWTFYFVKQSVSSNINLTSPKWSHTRHYWTFLVVKWSFFGSRYYNKSKSLKRSQSIHHWTIHFVKQGRVDSR